MIARIKSVAGETHSRLEDFTVVDLQASRLKIAVGDWANNLVGGPYKDRETACFLSEPERTLYNGGVIGAMLAKNTIVDNDTSGISLIYLLNEAITRKYEELEITGYEENRPLTFTGYFGHIIATPRVAIVTAVGDVKIALDGKIVAGKRKLVDEVHSNVRKCYIESTGDIEGGFDFVRPLIIRQYSFQNTPGNALAYPAIDGTETKPLEEIQTFDTQTPKHILIWTDGYVTPDEFTIEGLERKIEEVYQEDPFRCETYPAVGYPKDDRTAVEIIIDDNWNDLALQKL